MEGSISLTSLVSQIEKPCRIRPAFHAFTDRSRETTVFHRPEDGKAMRDQHDHVRRLAIHEKTAIGGSWCMRPNGVRMAKRA